MTAAKRGEGSDPAQQIRNLLALRIRSAREARGMTRKQLADGIRALGPAVTADAVRQWETAVASPRWLMSVAVAQVLNVSWLSLFSLEGETL